MAELKFLAHGVTRRSELPSEVTTGWTVDAEGASVDSVGASVNTVGASVNTVGASVSPVGASDTSVVPTPVESTATVPPGAGVAELKDPTFVVPTLTVEDKPDSVAAFANRA